VRWYPPLRQNDAAHSVGGRPFSSLRANLAAIPAVSAEALCRGGYRQIEQTLALLVHDPDVDARTLQRFATALGAHLDAADNLLYTIVETSRNSPLTEQRQLNHRLRSLLAKATKSGIGKTSRRRWLRALESSFRKHVRLNEQLALH
jgi:hypothetical protein